MDYIVALVLTFWETSILFSIVAVPMYIPTAQFLFSPHSPTLLICCLIIAILTGVRWQLTVLLISISLVVSVRCRFWQKLCFWEGGRAGSPWSRVKADRLSCHKYRGLGEGEGVLSVKSGGSRFGSASNSASLFLHLAWASLPRFPHCLNFPIRFLEETRPSGAVSHVKLTWSCGWQASRLRKWYLLSTLSAVLLQCVPSAGVGAPGMQGSSGPAGLTGERGAPGEPGAPGRAGAAGEQ